jgi:hypothetical protein
MSTVVCCISATAGAAVYTRIAIVTVLEFFAVASFAIAAGQVQ